MEPIDLRCSLTNAEARTADLPIQPALVVAAFQRTGLRPVRGIWLDRRDGCGCGIGALVAEDPALSEDETPGAYAVAMTLTGKKPLQIGDDAVLWLEEFANAFDRATVEHLREDLTDHLTDTKLPGWFILSWRNALAVREALAAAGLDPAPPEAYPDAEEVEA